MRSRTEAALAGLIVLALTGACADPATQQVSLEYEAPVPLVSGVTPPPPLPASSGPALPPRVLATSLAEAVATGEPLPSTGSPRFFVTARAPIAHEVSGTKTSTFTPVHAAVNDAKTGAFLAEVPLPPGVPSSWQLVTAAPDNRTFVLGGWTGPGKPIRFYRVRLGENGEPGTPELLPDTEPEPDHVSAIALSRDGTKLAYVCMPIGGGTKVAVLDFATGRRRDWFTPTPSMVMGLAWAPDGRRLAMATVGRGIALLDLEPAGSDLISASRVVRPLTGVAIPGAVAFTPDGRSLVYSKGHDVERVPVDGGEPQALARPALPPGASLDLRFRLDGTGRYLIYTHGRRAHRIDLADGSATSVPIDAGERSGEGAPPVVAW